MSHISEYSDDENDSLEETTDQMIQQSQTTETAEGKGPKKRKLKSKVWEHFKFLKKKNPADELKVECKGCHQIFSGESKNGTGNHKRHLKKCKKMKTKDIGQYLLSVDKGLGTRAPKFSQDKFRDLLVHAVIKHELPFSFVEYDGVRNLCSYLEPEVKHISRNTAKTDVRKLHSQEIARLKNELQSCPSRICLTSDAWSSIVSDGYVSLTAHFVDSNWVLQKRILNFSYMPPPHSGVALADKLYKLATGWNIENKLFSITLDNASANDACVQILKRKLRLKDALFLNGDLFHVRCCAHILNLVVQDGLKEIDSSVDKVRECVKYVKGSQVRKVKFRECVAQTSTESGKALVQDVSTRWNSTYKMLECALHYRLAFSHLELSDSNFKCCLCDEEWDRVGKICNFLKVFHDATVAFSGSKYPTANLFFLHFYTVQFKLFEHSRNSEDRYMKKIAEQMFANFDKYWSDFNILLAMGFVFDPRYRFSALKWSYEKLYGPDCVELSKVKLALTSIFREYVNAAGKEESSSTIRSTNDTLPCAVASSNSIFKEFHECRGFVGTQQSELETYFSEPISHTTVADLDVLDYWKSQLFRFPVLAKLARDILCVPISTVASESAFSLGGRIIDPYRSSLSPEIAEALVCTKDWLFARKESTDLSLEDFTHDIMASNVANDDDVACVELCSNVESTVSTHQ